MGDEILRLPGVDLDDARARLVDDTPFLLTLLREFVRHSIAIEKSLSIGSDAAGVEDARRKMHQLRGGAANLAVRSVEGTATRLELSLKDFASGNSNQSRLLPVIRELRGDLRRDLTTLRDALQRATVGIEEQPIVPSGNQEEQPDAPPENGKRILVIDDSAAMRRYIKAVLENCPEGLQIIEAADGLKGFRRLAEERPDLAICDLQMPEFGGMKLLSMRATRPELMDIPVIMLTAEHETERKLEVLDRGAVDYITKPFHGRELIARVGIHLGMGKLRDEACQLRALVDELSTVDELTGVYNRRYFESILLEEVQRTTRYAVPLAIVTLRIGGLGELRKAHGLGVVEKILIDTGRVLVDSIRTTDKAARIGFDKFCLLLPHTGHRGATTVAERVRRALLQQRLRAGERQVTPTASFGTASSEGAPVSAREMIDLAEKSLLGASETAGAQPPSRTLEKQLDSLVID